MTADNLVELFGASAARSFWEAAERTLGKTTEGVAERVVARLPVLLQPLLPAFAGEFTRLMIAALLQREDANRRLEVAVRQIQETPFKTGVEQLRLALDAPVNTVEQATHRMHRFREARNNLDTASQQSSREYRPIIDFYRGLASFHISGAAFEAAEHWKSFGCACTERAAVLLASAEREATLASRFKAKAEAIPFERVRGGGGISTFDRAMGQANRARLVALSRRHGAAEDAFRTLAASLYEANAQTSVLVVLAKAKDDGTSLA